MKKINIIRYIGLLMGLSLLACSKSDENLDVDLSKYNSDTYVKTAVDDWITTNLTTPFNIQVVYRFERNLTDVSRDISPSKLETVQPTMELVLDGFINVYKEVAGSAFIKTYTPKQFVLYGSGSYNSNNSYNLGTADGGRRVVLYDTNGIDLTNPENARRRLRTIHHEFTHIVNQIINIPTTFEPITAADYFADWTNASNTAAVAKGLGFISPYARSAPGEDFAEMTSHLLVEGQVWFNNYVATASPSAQPKLLAKERIVRDYFKTFFDIDFNELQGAVQRVLKENYNAKDPTDITQTLPIWLNRNLVSTIRYQPSAAHYGTFGNPAAIRAIFTNMQAAFREQNPGWPTGTIEYFEFRFTDAQNMVFRIAFKIASNSNDVYFADYYFGMQVSNITGEVQFSKTTSAGLHNTSNGNLLLNGFERHLLPYLTNRVFVADWLPTTIGSTSNLYRTFGGFYVKDAPTNYIYGPIVLK
ncbi:substrate import-associated zinc metallohydrolase lipoprotein [Sphingobacterium deserti]|nr:substrate import-associated zinc metallohydrolase lipoprotein [Sphingobacterium deserti]